MRGTIGKNQFRIFSPRPKPGFGWILSSFVNLFLVALDHGGHGLVHIDVQLRRNVQHLGHNVRQFVAELCHQFWFFFTVSPAVVGQLALGPTRGLDKAQLGYLVASGADRNYHGFMSKTILLVEDDTLVRESLARVLGDKGLTVLQATNGKEGLEKALAGGVDLVITDVIMPEVDGLTMLAKLREDSKGKDLPAIILSNDDQTESLNQALQAGVTVYLSKAALDAEAISEQILIALGN